MGSRGAGGCRVGGSTRQSKAPGGEGRSQSQRRGTPGSGGHGPRSEREDAGPARREREGAADAPPPLLRPAAGRRPRSLPRSVPGALSAAPPPATAAGASGPGEEKAAAGRAGAQGPGASARGRRARKSGGCFQERAVPAPRSLRPAPRWAGRAEPRTSRRAGFLVPPGLQRDDPSTPAAPGRLPALAASTPRMPLPTHTGRRRISEEEAVARLHPGLLPIVGLPTRYQGEPAGRYWADRLTYMYTYIILHTRTYLLYIICHSLYNTSFKPLNRWLPPPHNPSEQKPSCPLTAPGAKDEDPEVLALPVYPRVGTDWGIPWSGGVESQQVEGWGGAHPVQRCCVFHPPPTRTKKGLYLTCHSLISWIQQTFILSTYEVSGTVLPNLDTTVTKTKIQLH